jgi:hypothetical protein
VLTGVAVLTTAVTVLSPMATGSHGDRHPPGPIEVKGDYHSGVVTTRVETPGRNQSAVKPVRYSSSASGVTCRWIENSPFVEKTYRQLLGWGSKGGHWYDILCSDGTEYRSIYVPPAANNLPPVVALAGALARRATNQLPLPRPDVALNPSPRALVNLPEWFWVQRSSWRTLRQRTQAGPVWVIVRARPTSTTWDPGDGSVPFECAGRGVPYVKSEPAEAQHSDCTYAYSRSSANEPQSGPDPNDRFFTVTVTTTWSVTWTGAGGAGGALPPMTRSSSFRLAVAERDAVVTGGSG